MKFACACMWVFEHEEMTHVLYTSSTTVLVLILEGKAAIFTSSINFWAMVLWSPSTIMERGPVSLVKLASPHLGPILRMGWGWGPHSTVTPGGCCHRLSASQPDTPPSTNTLTHNYFTQIFLAGMHGWSLFLPALSLLISITPSVYISFREPPTRPSWKEN